VTTEIPTPFDRFRETVRREWIDYNGHLNVAYYVLIFDHATDAFFDYLGVNDDYRARANCSIFALEDHLTYVGEVKLGDNLRITSQLIAHDHKRVHFFHRMYHADQGYVAATYESMNLHVDLGTRRSAPFPAEMQRHIDAVGRAHAALPRPEEVGRGISLDRPRRR
jgi:acyl-CoA thioester hydrolase